jgi:hypothetical protein
MSVAFDDPNLVSAAGLVPAMALAQRAGLADLAGEHLSVPTDKGANAGLKVTSLVAGMVAGADSIDDMALLRHGGMGRIFARAYAPSTLGSFLRAFTFGHVRQLDAVASRFLLALAALVGFAGPARRPAGDEDDTATAGGGYAFVDVDDTIIEVHGHAKQGAGFGYTRVRGLNALIATVTTPATAPVVVAQRLRKGACGSPRGAKRLVGDAVKQTRRLLGEGRPVLVRMDSAYYGRDAVHAAITGGAAVSVTVRLDPAVKAAIASIGEDAWTTIKYPNAIFDEATGTWVSKAEVAEVPYTAFTSRKKAERVRAASSCAGSPTCTRPGSRPPGRAPCSTCGASTRSSPPCPPISWTPSRRTAPTAATRSSSRSTPTSKPPRWRTCRPGGSPPTVPGSCSRSSRSTSPAPPPPSPRHPSWSGRPPPLCAAS